MKPYTKYKLAKIKPEIVSLLINELLSKKSDPISFIHNLQAGDYDKYFTDDKLDFPNPKDQVELTKPGNEIINDYEFGKELYKTLSNISLSDANDKRLWMYLSLYVFKDWVIKRGKYNHNSKYDTIKENLFFEGNSSTVNYSNHISRLWWAFKMTETKDLEDNFYYTKILLSNSQIWFDLSERKDIYNNKKLLKCILEFFEDKIKSNQFSASKLSASITPSVLNHLKNFDLNDFSKEEIKNLLEEFLNNLVSNGYLYPNN